MGNREPKQRGTEEYLVFASWDKHGVYVSSKINNRSNYNNKDKVFYSLFLRHTLSKGLGALIDNIFLNYTNML